MADPRPTQNPRSRSQLASSRPESLSSHSQVEFAGELKRSGLLTHAQFVDAVTLCKQHAKPVATARILVQQGLLTTFQAEQILLGQGHCLSLGPYRVLRPLSDGGVGRIYLGMDTRSEQRVAIKMLRESRRNNPRAVQRFRVEGRALLAMNHKNLLKGLAYQKVNPQLGWPAHLVTDVVEGPNLRELLAIRKRLPWHVVCDMIAQAAAGLQHAHEKGFVHRDIKPSNLMALASGRVLVIDFGMVRYCTEDPDWFSPPPARLGFADYLAPEQLADREHVDGRADIYSLGSTMFYLLIGKAPIKFATRSAPPPSLRQHREDIPETLERIVHKMLAGEVEQRYQSMAEVQQALQPLARRASLIIDYPALLRARATTSRGGEVVPTEDVATESSTSSSAVAAGQGVAAVAADRDDTATLPASEPPSSLAATQLAHLETLVENLSQRLIDSQRALADAEAKIANDARLAEQQLTLWRREKADLLRRLRHSEQAREQAEQARDALEHQITETTQRAAAMTDAVAALEHRLAEQNEDLTELRDAYDRSRQDD